MTVNEFDIDGVSDGNINYLKLNDISAYKTAFELSNYVWEVVSGWNYFAKDTLGKQLVKAVDSISANIAEGFGRYGKKDKIKFYRYSLGSLKEALDWNEKAKVRQLINQKDYDHIFNILNMLPKEIYNLINYTNQKLKY
ncbi:MAG: four helix bundle protein [Bacteroidales bacterium]|nr:four helix bundle protein [Bacteroidales bacterium]